MFGFFFLNVEYCDSGHHFYWGSILL